MQRCVELPWSAVASLARSVSCRSYRTSIRRNGPETARVFARSIQCRSYHAARSDADTALFESPRNLLRARGTIIRKVNDGSEHRSIIEAVHAIRKSSICREYRLQPRDLSALDTEIEGRRAQILVRPGTIIFSADVRAVIRHDKALILERKEDDRDADNAPSTPAPTGLAKGLQEEMRRIAVQGELTQFETMEDVIPFEFLALEALLRASVRKLADTSEELQTGYRKLLDQLATSETIPTRALQDLMTLKDATEDFKRRAEDFREAVAEVLREEADMSKMYLTELSAGKVRQIGDDDEIELLLEIYRHHGYSLTDVATTLLTRLHSITNHVTLLLSSTRNRLLNMEITIAFTTLGTSLAALVGAMFGMNLTSGLEETPYMYNFMVAFSVALAGLCIRVGRRALVRARSIKAEHSGILHQSPAPLHHSRLEPLEKSRPSTPRVPKQ